MRVFSTTSLLAAACVLLMGANVAVLNSFKVEKANSDLKITWQAEQEAGVREYELFRRSSNSNNQYVKIQRSFPAHGVGRTYTYVDDQVYKSNSQQIGYRLEVVYDNGVRQILRTQNVDYTSTAVRRTWGSIKAMFQ
ncbi:MAG: hypothetical protein AAGJ10_19515 [Bacteroidota bacterium]